MDQDLLSFRVVAARLNDARLMADMNRHLIEDEGSQNDMNDVQLYQRMRSFLQGRYSGWIPYVGTDPAGYLLTLPQGSTLYIRHFFVTRPYRRQGVGRLLMNWCIDHLGSNYARITLDVLSHNERGIAFWRELGFDDLHIHMEYDLDGHRRRHK